MNTNKIVLNPKILRCFNVLKHPNCSIDKSSYRYFTSNTTGYKTLHNAGPRLPLLYYKASTDAMKSMNHRLFYANLIFMMAAYDLVTTFIDF